MKTELKPKIKSGFFLTDVEITRIKDAQNEQIKKINGGNDANFLYEVKYLNGAISIPRSLEEILVEENYGSKRIVRFVMHAFAADPEEGLVSVQFSDVSFSENSDDTPISYAVASRDKDWTFVTASTIGERLTKTKTGGVLNLFSQPNVSSFMPVIFGFLPLLMLPFIRKSSEEKTKRVQEIFEKTMMLKN